MPLSLRGIVAGIIMVFVPALGYDYVTPDLLGGAKDNVHRQLNSKSISGGEKDGLARPAV